MKEPNFTHHLIHGTVGDQSDPRVIEVHDDIAQHLLDELQLVREVLFPHTGRGVDQEYPVQLLTAVLDQVDVALEDFAQHVHLQVRSRIFRLLPFEFRLPPLPEVENLLVITGQRLVDIAALGWHRPQEQKHRNDRIHDKLLHLDDTRR